MIKIINRTAALERMILESEKQIIPESSKFAKLMSLSAMETSGFLDQALLDFNVFAADGRLIRKLIRIDFEELINPQKSSLIKDLKTFISTNHLAWDDIIETEGRIVIKNKALSNGENRSEIAQFIPIMDEEFSENNPDLNVKGAVNGN